MIKITKADAICNLGENLDEIFVNLLKGKLVDFKITTPLPVIMQDIYNIRCNRMLLHCINKIQPEIDQLIVKYGNKKIGVVIATTNTGIDDYEETHNYEFLKMSNPAEFVKNYLDLDGPFCGVSTACSSGIKAFLTAKKWMNSGICDAVIAGGTDAVSRFPLAGFSALEVLSDKRSNPFSKNPTGINISEAAALFILEKDTENGINILGIGETSDAYHASTPNPDGEEAANAMILALEEAKLKPEDIDYVNLHGTGTIANDKMEANAIYKVFGSSTFVSATKPLTGHCLGASASIETAICYELLKNDGLVLPPHIYDGEYNPEIPKINLVSKNTKIPKLEHVMCNAFGFGGTNAVIILGK